MTHPYLPDLDAKAQEREIVESKTQLEQILGKSVHHFSCPGGRFDDQVVKTVKRAGYHTLATSRLRMNFGSSDRYSLGRVAVMCDMSDEGLARICRGEGFWKMSLRQSLQDTSKRVLGNRLYDRLRGSLLNQSDSQ